MPRNNTRNGFVDLGLPSGTLWSEDQEPREYSHDEAQKKFRPNLPSLLQWRELVLHCKWEWTPDGFLVRGPNGKTICMPVDVIFPFRRKNRKAGITRIWLNDPESKLTAGYFDNYVYRRHQALLHGLAHVRTVLSPETT